MLAAQLDTTKYQITLCEKKKTVGRKFLVAGEGGLNLTYNASVAELIAQYSPSEFMAPIIGQFTNEDLLHWLSDLGVTTFTGSSSRVFPAPGLKPIEVLNKVVMHLSAKEIKFLTSTEWLGWAKDGNLRFEGTVDEEPDVVVFALGGASWRVTGSDGAWSKAFAARGVNIRPFRAANCAFGVAWSKQFVATHAGKPLKNIALAYNGHVAKGELVVSKFGLEGNAIYALSEKIQDALLTENHVVVHLDLKPTMTVDQLRGKYQQSKRSKVTDILKEDLNLDRTSISLVKQFTDKDTFLDPDSLVTAIKSVPIPLRSADEMDKAISTLGGIALDEVDKNFQLNKIPNSYAIGEMLDWYAPTGGYLLQGCFSMGFVLAKHLNALQD